MKTITYVSYYSKPDDMQGRKSVPACSNKMDSIMETLTHMGYQVNILSACGAGKEKVYGGRLDRLSDQVSLRFFPSFPWTNIINKILCRISIFGGLFWQLIHLHKDDKVIVYHSLDYMPVINLAHKIRRFKLIMEVEEIYSDVTGKTDKKEKEIAYLRKADRYIFPTVLLAKLINMKDKPYAIIHGTYRAEAQRNMTSFSNEGNQKETIHCVYAGTFDPRKGGPLAAASAAYLPANYHVHIIGFGSKQDTETIKETIRNVGEKSQCLITYDGLKQGEEYIRFIQSCDIGLSTQDPSAAFNATSFPSKILSYLANGLRVVSIKIPAIETSDVGDLLYYYVNQTPQGIAEAILSVDMKTPYDSRKRIVELNRLFEMKLQEVLD